MQENTPTRTRQASVSAALAAVRAQDSAAAASAVRFPAEDGGRSLAEVAQRDLDSALQLLADRAQYITGASGAAIALRRSGKNDMLCRASTGSAAPELGALLSTEFGLSGESVRTRQALRCDDAERDVRVNRDVCRQMGIASVVVMPVVNDDEVLGVLELFSGKANAFGARDVSAVQRLSEMVETAVRLARATENLPDRLKTAPTSAPEVQNPVQDAHEREAAQAVRQSEVPEDQILEGQVLAHVVVEASNPENPVLKESALTTVEVPDAKKLEPLKTSTQRPIEPPSNPKANLPAQAKAAQEKAPQEKAALEKAALVPAEAQPKKKLFWSAAANPVADAAKRGDEDQSHVPPVLRGLRKCEACGFPISAGRALCVECEEKKWRGHLKVPKVVAPLPKPAVSPTVHLREPTPTATEVLTKESNSIAGLEAQRNTKPARSTAPAVTVATAPKAEARAFAAAQSAAAVDPNPSTVTGASGDASKLTENPSKAAGGRIGTTAPEPIVPAAQTADAPEEENTELSSPEFVLSAGLAPSQSWLSRSMYILGVLAVVAVVVAAIFLLR
jgi:GAF domain-containing protein